MMESINQFVDFFCSPFGQVGLDCGRPVIIFRLGHIALVIVIFVAVVGILRLTVFRNPTSRGFSHPVKLSFERNPHKESRVMYVDPFSLAEALGREPDTHLKTKLEKNLNKDRLKRWYVVEIHEGQKRLVRQEMRVLARARGFEKGDGALDKSLIEIVRARNESVLDDDYEGEGVEGRYTVTFRQVKWFDFGHWLTHPNRDVRLGLWLAIIATTIEYSDKIVGFGLQIWRAF